MEGDRTASASMIMARTVGLFEKLHGVIPNADATRSKRTGIVVYLKTQQTGGLVQRPPLLVGSGEKVISSVVGDHSQIRSRSTGLIIETELNDECEMISVQHRKFQGLSPELTDLSGV